MAKGESPQIGINFQRVNDSQRVINFQRANHQKLAFALFAKDFLMFLTEKIRSASPIRCQSSSSLLQILSLTKKGEGRKKEKTEKGGSPCVLTCNQSIIDVLTGSPCVLTGSPGAFISIMPPERYISPGGGA